MQIPQQNLRIPGPTPCPNDILQGSAKPMINHRGPEFEAILLKTTKDLRHVFETDNDLYILTASGQAHMKASKVNRFISYSSLYGYRFNECLVPSRAEAKRLINQNAVEVNGQKATEDSPHIASVSGSVIKIGRRKFVRIVNSD